MSSNWKELVDQTSQKTYYANSLTGEVTWTRPAEMDSEKPIAFLILGKWHCFTDKQSGRDYYADEETKQVTWECPTEIAAAVQQHKAQSSVRTIPKEIATMITSPHVPRKRGASINRKPFAVVGPWQVFHDDRSGKDYFANTHLHQVQWECPPELQEVVSAAAAARAKSANPTTSAPATVRHGQDHNNTNKKPVLVSGSWIAYSDENTGRHYFCDSATGSVSWDCPQEMQSQYEEMKKGEAHYRGHSYTTSSSSVHRGMTSQDDLEEFSSISMSGEHKSASSSDGAKPPPRRPPGAPQRPPGRPPGNPPSRAVSAPTSSGGPQDYPGSPASPSPDSPVSSAPSSKHATITLPEKHGMLLRKTGGLLKKWVPRYFRCDRGTLSHWDQESLSSASPNSGDAITLLGLEVSIPEDGEKQHVFKVGQGETELVLTAESDADREDWINTIVGNGAINTTVSLKHGELVLRPEKKGKWCVLTPNKILLFKKQEDKKPSGSIPLTQYTTVEVDRYTCEFTLKEDGSGKPPYVLSTDTREEQGIWAEKISVAIGALKGVFGGPLRVAVLRSPYPVPEFLVLCCAYLTGNGITTEGLFRVPGSNDRVQLLRNAFIKGEVPEFLDPHSVAGVIKLYFRELSDPLIPCAVRQDFMSIAGSKASDGEKAAAFVKLLATLPMENVDTLSYLCNFLTAVARHHTLNKMDAENCAMVFAPGLLRASRNEPEPTNPQELAEQLEKQKFVIRFLIEHYGTIFKSGPPC